MGESGCLISDLKSSEGFQPYLESRCGAQQNRETQQVADVLTL
jgi:hypothetical protein